MPMLNCYVSEDDLRTLRIESERSGRKVEDLAEAAISEACSEARRADSNLRLGRDARGTPIGSERHVRAPAG